MQLQNQEKLLLEQIELKRMEEEEQELIRIKQNINNRITEYVTKFKTKWHRTPLVDDVIEALSDIDENDIRTHELLNDNVIEA